LTGNKLGNIFSKVMLAKVAKTNYIFYAYTNIPFSDGFYQFGNNFGIISLSEPFSDFNHI
jgi:hypothetical protein